MYNCNVYKTANGTEANYNKQSAELNTAELLSNCSLWSAVKYSAAAGHLIDVRAEPAARRTV